MPPAGYRIAEKMGDAKGKLPEKGRPSVMGPVINAREQLTRVPRVLLIA